MIPLCIRQDHTGICTSIELLYYSAACTNSFSVVNTGKVTIHYQWIMLDDSGGTATPVGELHLNDAGSIVSEGGDCPAFTFEPSMGKIAVGEEAHFVVKFSPLDVQDMHATFQCV